MAERIQGRLIAEEIRKRVCTDIETFPHPPGLAVILVGENPASKLYVELKERAAKEVGIYFEKIEFPENATEGKIIKAIKKLNERTDIHGILVQLPLPTQDENAIIPAIDPKKDVDGFHPKNIKRLLKGESALIPPVANAVSQLIEATRQPLYGKSAIIVSNHEIFSKPISKLLSDAQVHAEYISPGTTALAAKLRAADILIVAVGKRNFLTKDMVKEGAIVIDVGTNKKGTHVVGDAHLNVMDVAAFVSPVPGGVGPLTVANLLANVAQAAHATL